jgi:hypothetical protein
MKPPGKLTMMRSFLNAAVCALLAAVAIASPAGAASPSPVLTVESVLSPAWIERTNGRRDPLAIGMALSNGEKVHTGDGGRAMLRLSEGSAVKMGEGGMLIVSDLLEKADAKGAVVNASLDVVRGAFRFTTGLLGKSNAQRNVNIKVNAVTAGIRGTDVWGKSEDERDIVCLLEGRVTVTHGPAQFTMQEPNAFYIAPRKGKAAPPSTVSVEQVREWSAETEIDPRTGASRRGGTAFVVAASATDERSANAQRDKLRDSGFPADVARAADGRYEVRIGSLSDAVAAGMLADRLRKLGFPQAK